MKSLSFDWRRSLLYARDGSGNYSLPQAAFVPGTTIETTKVNSDFSDIASALTQSMSKDGQTTPTANQPMGGFKFTGLGAGTGNGESIRYDEFKAAFRSFLAGLTLSNNAAPNTKLDVAAGACADDTNAAVLTIVAGTIDCATTGALGLDAGSLANSTWYHVYAIGKADGTTSLLASTSATSPTQPSGYIYKRRLGSFKTDGSAHIIAFIQDGDLFQWTTQTSDQSSTSLTNGVLTALTINVPLGVRVLWQGRALGQCSGSGSTFGIDLYTPGTGSISLGILGGGTNGTVTTNAVGATFVSVMTNTSRQINALASNNNCSISLATAGWIDRRGRDA